MFTKSYNEHMDHGLDWTDEDGTKYLEEMANVFNSVLFKKDGEQNWNYDDEQTKI